MELDPLNDLDEALELYNRPPHYTLTTRSAGNTTFAPPLQMYSTLPVHATGGNGWNVTASTAPSSASYTSALSVIGKQ